MIKDKLNQWRLRSELRRVFNIAGIYREYQSYNKPAKVFPVIHVAEELNGKIRYVFTLIDGIDPKDVNKKLYVFQQAFGRNIKLDGDLKKYVLHVYKDSFKKEIIYNPLTINQAVKGLSLPILAGVNQNHDYISFDMINHPHLLIAGETGSGKSTQLRSILTTLINNLPQNKLHLYLADLKRSEFHLFKRISHVKSVSVKASHLKTVLVNLRNELVQRSEILDQNEAMNIDDLPFTLPYIILAIDEVALLKKEKEIMDVIEEISAIGRALGCFLILSMQRPDSKVLDGKLKLNLTVRMGFKSADRINSNIIGTAGSEKLEHSGKFIMKITDLQLIQAPYLTSDKAKRLLEPYKVKQSENASETVTEGLKQEDNKIKLGLLEE